MEQKTWWKGVTYPAASTTSPSSTTSSSTCSRSRSCSSSRCRARRPGCGWRSASSPDPLAPRLPRHLRARDRGDLDVLVLLPRARPGARPLRDGHRGADAPRYFQVGGLAEDIPRGFYEERRKFCEQMPRRSTSTRRSSTRTRSGWSGRGRRPALGRGRDRARPAGPEPSRLRCRLGPSQARALSRLRPGRLRRSRLRRRRRLRPLQGARRRDAGVDEDHRAVHRPARGDAGRAWIADDRKVVLPPREELHTSMESLIHHFKIVTEGTACPRARSTSGSSRRAASRLLPRLRRGPKPWRVKFRAPSFAALTPPAGQLPSAASLVRRAARDRGLLPDAVADLIAVVGSLDAVMGDVDR